MNSHDRMASDPEKQQGQVPDSGYSKAIKDSTYDSITSHSDTDTLRTASSIPALNTANRTSDIEKQSPVPTSPFHTVFSRTPSTNTARVDYGPPPDGGAKAWLQVFAAHLVIFNSWGNINSYGVFQNYYVNNIGSGPSAVAWVGSVQIFLVFFIGTFSGRLVDAGYFRHVLVAGSLIQLLGVFTTSLGKAYWQLFLAQGLCTGLGAGMLFCPMLALVPQYFSKRRAVAMGIVVCGASTGGMVFPAMTAQLLPRIGFAWTIRVIGLVMLVLQVVAFLILKPRLPPGKPGPIVEWAAFKEPPYALFAVGMFLCFWGLYPGFYYVGEYASSVLHLDQQTSIYLLLVMNGVGLVGRMVPAWFADRYTGPMSLLVLSALAGGVVMYSWMGVDSKGGIYAFAVVYGMAAAGFQGLFPAALSMLTDDVEKMGIRIGMSFSVFSFACLTGSPIAGALIESHGWVGMQCFAASALVAGSLMLGASRVSKVGWSLKVKM